MPKNALILGYDVLEMLVIILVIISSMYMLTISSWMVARNFQEFIHDYLEET